MPDKAIAPREYLFDLYLGPREELFAVPDDFIDYEKVGFPITVTPLFNHSTKIAILRVKR